VYVTAEYPAGGLSGSRFTEFPVVTATSLSNDGLAPVLKVVGCVIEDLTANQNACGTAAGLFIYPLNVMV
jgi:hypothetical protein